MATSSELGGATWFGDSGSSLTEYVWAPTAPPLRCSGPLRKLAAELQLIDKRKLRDHVPLGLEFDYVQLAGEEEAWNADALMEAVRAGTGRRDFLAALEDRVKAEETQWAPLLQLHFPDLLDDYLNRDGATILQERTDGCARLCRLGSEKAGASQESVGGQEGHRRGSSPGAGRLGKFGGASAEGPSS